MLLLGFLDPPLGDGPEIGRGVGDQRKLLLALVTNAAANAEVRIFFIWFSWTLSVQSEACPCAVIIVRIRHP